jgi:hypothetical protein
LYIKNMLLIAVPKVHNLRPKRELSLRASRSV